MKIENLKVWLNDQMNEQKAFIKEHVEKVGLEFNDEHLEPWTDLDTDEDVSLYEYEKGKFVAFKDTLTNINTEQVEDVPELPSYVVALLKHSFEPINFRYESLTKLEKELISPDQFTELLKQIK